MSVDLNHQTAPGYDRDAGCKWMLHNLKSYLMSRHDQQAVNVMFRCPPIPHPSPLTPHPYILTLHPAALNRQPICVMNRYGRGLGFRV